MSDNFYEIYEKEKDERITIEEKDDEINKKLTLKKNNKPDLIYDSR